MYIKVTLPYYGNNSAVIFQYHHELFSQQTWFPPPHTHTWSNFSKFTVFFVQYKLKTAISLIIATLHIAKLK